MKLQEIQNQALQLPTSDRWQLVQVLLDSLKQEANPTPKQRNLSRLRGIAKLARAVEEGNTQAAYKTYLIRSIYKFAFRLGAQSARSQELSNLGFRQK